jgi:hypothetical protein
MRLNHRLTGVGLAIVAEVSIARASGLPPGEHVRLAIAVDGLESDVAQYAALMIAEADGIWRRYGITISHIADDLTRVDLRLTVIIKSPHAPVAGRRPDRSAYADRGLGEIAFDENGRPANTIVIDGYAVAVTVKQTPVSSCPPALVKLTVARALGRVLAHEIGHYLLALPSHAPHGLMRANFAGGELAGLGRQTFVLSGELIPRLRTRLARLRLEP